MLYDPFATACTMTSGFIEQILGLFDKIIGP